MASVRDARRERYSTFGSGNGVGDQSKTKLTNRWEIVLVLIVVAAGIVITTIAAIKAKEKSDIDFNDDGLIKSANEVHEITSRPGSPQPTTSLPTRPHYITTTSPPALPTETMYPTFRDTTYLKPQNEFVMPTLPTEQGMDPQHHHKIDQGQPLPTPPRGSPIIPNRFDDGFNGFYGPDYDQEYDLVQPKGVSGLPIRPTTADISSVNGGDKPGDQDPMTAESNEESGNRQQSNNPFLYQPMGAYGHPGGVMSDGLPAFPPPRGFHVSNEHNRNAELAADSAGFVLDELLLAAQQQHHQQAVQAPSSASKTRRHYPSDEEIRRFQSQLDQQQLRKSGQGQLKPSATQFAPTVDATGQQVPLSMFLPGLSLPSTQNNQKLPVFVAEEEQQHRHHRKHHQHDKSMTGNGPAYADNGNREQSQSSKFSIAQQLAAQFLPSGLIPRFPSFRQQRARRSARLWDLIRRQSSLRHQRRRRAIRTSHNETLAASESGYFPFNEENIPGPVMDYNDYAGSPRRSRYQSSAGSGSNRRPRKRTRPNHANNYNYGSAETRHGKKSYGILGSGNFEVIRGGIYNDEEGSASDTSYVRGAQRPNSNKNDDTDYFTGDAVLGFQGYDNFQSASNQKEKLKKLKGQSVTGPMQSSHPEPVFVDLDQDLIATA